MRAFFVLSVLAVPTTALADHPLGATVPAGVLVDVTEEGFGLIEPLASGFVPPSIPVPPAGARQGSFDCFFCTGYRIDVSGLVADITLDDLTLTPQTGALQLDADATIAVNSRTDPGTLVIEADLAVVGDVIDDTCDVWVDPIVLSLGGSVELELVPDPNGVDVDGDAIPDTRRLDADVDGLTWDWDADGHDFRFANCGLASAMDDVNRVTLLFGVDVYDLLWGWVEPTIDDLVDDLVSELPGQIEPLLEDAFSSLTVRQSLDLAGVPLDLTLWPDTLLIEPAGMRIGMATVVDAPVDPCVAPYGVGASLATAGAPPAIGQTNGLPLTEHLGAMVDDDWVNHLLFAAWSGGLLCYDLPSPGLELPLPVDTNLLGLIAPDTFDHLFPETEPIVIRTEPRLPPVLDVAGPHDLDVVADDLGLGFYAELDGRLTRLLNIDLDGNVGVDLAFDANTGDLALGVDAGGAAFVPAVTYNEFAPDQSQVIEATFGGMLGLIVDPLLGGALGGLAFPVPSFEGIGVLDLEAQSVGANGDFVGVFAEAGTVPYPSAGCGGAGGGCDGTTGCATGGPGGVLLALPLVIAGLRRRSR